MPLLDIDKTTIKLREVALIISAIMFLGTGVYRFETKMTSIEENQKSLELRIVYMYTLEIMKINNRIDLLEAKKFVFRHNFKRDTLSDNDYCNIVSDPRTNNKEDRKEHHHQLCMLIVHSPEYQRKKLVDVKRLMTA